MLLQKPSSLLGISSIKNVTLKLRPGYYESPALFFHLQTGITYFCVVAAAAGTNYDAYIISYVNVVACFDLSMRPRTARSQTGAPRHVN